MNERMTFLDDGGEGGSYSSKPSLSAQRMVSVYDGHFGGWGKGESGEARGGGPARVGGGATRARGGHGRGEAR